MTRALRIVGVVAVTAGLAAVAPVAVFAIGEQAAALQSAVPSTRATPATPAGAAEVIRRAIVARVGASAEVSVNAVDALDIEGPYREARPDPGARLGRPIRFTLVRDAGATVYAVASVTVSGDVVVPLHPIARGQSVASEDVMRTRIEWKDQPLRAMPSLAEVVTGRTLRALAAGVPVLPGAVVLRRAIEPGDRVTVIATSGLVQVSAEMVASDGGRIGDVIRVVNPDSRRYLRGRVVRTGVVEVTYER